MVVRIHVQCHDRFSHDTIIVGTPLDTYMLIDSFFVI